MNRIQNLNNRSLLFFGLFLFALILILGVFFPRPYFYIINDTETLPIANIVSAYIDGSILDFIHPAVPIIYIPALLLKVLPFNEDPEKLVLLARNSVMAINFFLIYFGLVFIHKISLLSTILFISFLFIFPASNHFLELTSPNGILIGLGIVICGLGFNLGDSGINKSAIFWYGLALAFAVSTKLQSSLLLVPFLVASFFIRQEEVGSNRLISLVVFVVATFLLFFGILVFPVIPAFPFWATYFPWGGELYLLPKNILDGVKAASFIIILGFAAFFILLVLLIKKLNFLEKLKTLIRNINYRTAYLFISALFLVAVIFNMIVTIQTGANYDLVGDATRNYLPFLGFFALFITRQKIKEKIRLGTMIGLIFLMLLIALKGYRNHELYKSSTEINIDFRNLIEESLLGQDRVVFYLSPYFISKDYFLLFTDYRYGQMDKMFQEQSSDLPFRVDPIMEHLRMLNSRYYDLPKDMSSKLSYKYINKLLSLEYLPSVHKNLLKNTLDAWSHKDICEEPFDDFKRGESFSLIVPDGLSYLGTRWNKDSGETNQFIDKLTNTWQDKCGFEVVSRKTKIVNSKKHFVLGINSKAS